MLLDEQLIKELSTYILAKTGKHYFGRIKATADDIMVSCPFHKEGQEQKPSCGIKLHSDEYGSVGTMHCFACHKTSNIVEAVKYMLGDKYNENEIETRFGLTTTLARETLVQAEENQFIKFQQPDKSNVVKEDMLRHYRQYHPYLAKRKISENTATVYDIGYDQYNDHITFPIRDIYKTCLGLGRRAIKEKQYHYPHGFEKPLYGVYELPEFIRHLYVVEGPFNLWSLYEYGKTGVALLGTGTSKQKNQLLKIQCKDYVLALDGDKAGHKGTFDIGHYLQKNGKEVYVACVPNGMDINDMTYEQFRSMMIVPFNEWKL